jgi:hypothetical protein
MRIYRAKPIAWTDSSVALLNEYGATLCTPAPPAPDNAPILPPVKTPVKNTVGAVSHAGSKSARMEQKRKLRKKILSCLFSL